MKTACPSCAKGLSVPDERVGAKVRCPACKQVFVVPKPEEEDVPEAELFDESATLPAPASSAMAAAKASAADSAARGDARRAKQLSARLAEGKLFLRLAETNLIESRPDLLELDLAREAFEMVLKLDPHQAEARLGLQSVAELRERTTLAIERRGTAKPAVQEEAAEQITSAATSTALEPAKSQGTGKKKSIWEHVSNFFTKYVCPKCNSRGGVETHHEVVDRYEHMGSASQTDYHYAADGYTQTGSTERLVQVLCETVVYDQYYRCDDCGHEWGERLSNTHRL